MMNLGRRSFSCFLFLSLDFLLFSSSPRFCVFSSIRKSIPPRYKYTFFPSMTFASLFPHEIGRFDKEAKTERNRLLLVRRLLLLVRHSPLIRLIWATKYKGKAAQQVSMTFDAFGIGNNIPTIDSEFHRTSLRVSFHFHVLRRKRKRRRQKGNFW